MTRTRTLHHAWRIVLPAAGLLGLSLLAGRSLQGAAPSAAAVRQPARVVVTRPESVRTAPSTQTPAKAAPPEQALASDEPLELRRDFHNRAERQRYYDAHVQYEAEMATALRRVVAELEGAETDEDELEAEAERGVADINTQELGARIHELEVEAQRHEQRSRRYADAR